LADAASAKPENGWLPVPVMPSMVHEILLSHKKIEEPWKPFGIEKCYWVSQKDWVYSVSFSAKKNPGECRLVFKGLKGKVTVYLNGIRIASHSDTAVPLVADLSGKLLPNNSLVLHFAKTAPDVKSGGKDPSKRNPTASYLGPNPMLYTSGPFHDILLEYTSGITISEVFTDFSLDETLKRGEVRLQIKGVCPDKGVKIETRLLDSEGEIVSKAVHPVESAAGEFMIEPVIEVMDPRLWWPRGYGKQHLYKVEIVLIVKGKIHQHEFRTIGFRRITMDKRLHFSVNGVPVFLRGADWVTPDLLTDVWDQEREEMLFRLAEHANFNAFRVWGGADTPHDNFYEMADQRGFLLWQDFPRLPLGSTEESIRICTGKAKKLIFRLKHHPSVLSWCGNNEGAMWAHEDYHKEFKDTGPWKGLPAAEAVGEVCRELDPDRYYQPSSPYFGMNPNDPREGNTHGYTNMWYVPGYDYLNFASEDIRIASPPLHSMEKFMLKEEIFPEGYSTAMLHGNMYPYPLTWLPYTTAESWKKTGPVEQCYDATDAASLVNRIGMAEGVYYRDTIERQRRGRPSAESGEHRSCGGYLAWKYNDSWPQIYGAKVDYFLEPYHAYYTLRDAYAPVLLSFDIGPFIWLWVVNDSTEQVTGTVQIQLYHLQLCEFRKEIKKEVYIEPGKSKVVVRLDQEGIRAFRREHILFASFTDKNGKVIARSNMLADIERRCIFPPAKLDVAVQNNNLVITTDKFARNINLQGNAGGDQSGWFFEDNYFDLLPGERKVVRILGRHRKGRITAKPWYSEYITNINWEKL